jgi:ornithine--oxo-acid transaminase
MGANDTRAASASAASTLMTAERTYAARNYDPLPVVLSHGEGAWITDVTGRRYLDLMSAYSAVSFGHAHPDIIGALVAQAGELAVTSRAFFNDRLPLLLERVTRLTGLPRAIPSSGGAEAVETSLKAVRKWAYKVKGVPAGQAEVIVCRNNFHGARSPSSAFRRKRNIAKASGRFRRGSSRFLTATLPRSSGDHAQHGAFLVEPVQGEGGIVVPRDGYLADCARICRDRRVLLVCDEIQTGLGRTGYVLACEHDKVQPDGVILGKALGGGLLPVSMFAATDDVMQVFAPGDHGSTFGGNPLASAVALAALDVLEREDLCARSASLGAWLLAELRKIDSPLVTDVRGRGMFIGIEVDTAKVSARAVVDRLLERGLLSKDTHGTVVRIAPPLVIAREDLAWAVGEIAATFRDLEGHVPSNA